MNILEVSVIGIIYIVNWLADCLWLIQSFTWLSSSAVWSARPLSACSMSFWAVPISLLKLLLLEPLGRCGRLLLLLLLLKSLLLIKLNWILLPKKSKGQVKITRLICIAYWFAFIWNWTGGCTWVMPPMRGFIGKPRATLEGRAATVNKMFTL